jgi:hypothetical protein
VACKATGGELKCRGLRPLCEGLERGRFLEGVEQLARVPSGLYLVVMEWMAAITSDHMGYPRFSGVKSVDVFREFQEPQIKFFQYHICCFKKLKLINK